jgi:hypothetical protein
VAIYVMKKNILPRLGGIPLEEKAGIGFGVGVPQ